MKEQDLRRADALITFGTDEPAEPVETLEVGRISANLQGVALRDIRIDGIEVLRGLVFVVRSKRWVTLDIDRTEYEYSNGSDRLEITMRGQTRATPPKLNFRGRVVLAANGSLEFTAELRAAQNFETNRTGFVLLHPIRGCAGRPLTIRHADGTSSDSEFPTFISPGQPAFNIKALTYEPSPGLEVTFRLEGEIFEMEDQRNWLDASFKTYSRALSMPRPYNIEADRPVVQSVTVTSKGRARASASRAGQTCLIEIGDVTGTVPGFGLNCADPTKKLPSEIVNRLRNLNPDHLLFGVNPGPETELRFSRIGKISRGIGGELVLETVVSGDEPLNDLEQLAAQMRKTEIDPARISVFMAPYLRAYQPNGDWPQTAEFEELYSAARKVFPGVKIGGGMYTHFTELNRKRQAAIGPDYLTHTFCPIVHDCDDTSIMQSLEAFPDIVATARTFAGNVPYRIGPAGLSLRHNPSGGPVLDNPSGIRMVGTNDDPRWRGLFAASYVVGLAAEACSAGLDAMTIGDVFGNSSLFATGRAPFRNGALLPVFHVVAALAAASRKPVISAAVLGNHPVRCVSWQRDDGRKVLLIANNGAHPVAMSVRGFTGSFTIATLDASSALAASRNPAYFRDTARRVDGEIDLAAYAVALIKILPS
jgi:D-apionolactonase